MSTASAPPDPRRWRIHAALSVALLTISVDNTILNVALPTIERDLGATTGELQWIVDSYILVFAGLLLTMGSLGDRFGAGARCSPAWRCSAPRRWPRRPRRARSCSPPPARDGHRRRADHARDALHPHERLPARGARQGDRPLGRRVRDRPGDRPDGRRPAARALRLGRRLPRQRAARARRVAAGARLVPESRDPSGPRLDPVGAGCRSPA
jgi:hypothetical protein